MFGPILSAGLSDRFEKELRERPLYATRSRSNLNGNRPYSSSSSLASTSRNDFNIFDGWESNSHISSQDTRDSTPEPPDNMQAEQDIEHKTTAGVDSDNDSDMTPMRTQPAAASNQSSHVKPHLWISLWFLITIPVIFWDAGYCFMRPRSMVGGDLHWIWKPYELYQDIDYVYGLPALQRGDGFTNAQSLLNIIENFMNIGYLYLAHVTGSPVAPVLGFASATMTLSKTFLYWAQEYYCGGCAVGHNDLGTLLLLWVLPNGLWLLVPSMIVYRFAKDISASLRVTDNTTRKVASGKKL